MTIFEDINDLLLKRPRNFILAEDGKTPVAVDLLTSARFFEKEREKYFRSTQIKNARVSTVFLCMNHNYGIGPPLLWETMIFEEPHFAEYQERYSSDDEAEAGHQEAIEMVKKFYEWSEKK